MPDIPSAVQAYRDWITTDKYAKVNPKQKEWILWNVVWTKAILTVLSGCFFLYVHDNPCQDWQKYVRNGGYYYFAGVLETE